MGTLLHEMLHAFFRIHRQVLEGDERIKEYQNHMGDTEHGPVWQDAALAVELAVNDPAFLNLGVSLWRRNSLYYEYAVSGKEGSHQTTIGLGIDVGLIAHNLKIVKMAHRQVITHADIKAEVTKQVSGYTGFL
jgi:hypothetical protein